MEQKIKQIISRCLINLGEDEGIKEFKTPNEDTQIRQFTDSMSIVALSVDIEELYEKEIGKTVRVLNDEDPNFMSNFESVKTLTDYILNLK